MSSSPLSSQLPVDYILGKYKIVKVLGQGGFGITYLATNLESSSQEQVVIKENFPKDAATRIEDYQVCPLPGKEDDFEYISKKFFTEVQTLSSLAHPCIVNVKEYFKANNTSYYVMPYVEGKSLGDVRQENGPFLEQDLVNILTDILDALNFLHQRQRIHRDIKPENILLTSDLKPMLLDFGTVRELNSANPFTKIGTPKYAPFEQMQTNGEIGPWSDLYSLGATMYDLVAGEPPIPSLNRITMDGSDPYVPLSRRPECLALYSPQLLQTIDHALISDHRQRYQNAQEWLNALKPTPATTSEPTKTASSIGESLPDGYVLNGYTIIKTIGQGGFGITYLAEDHNLHHKVVIKENFPTEFVHRDAEYQVQTRLTQKKTEVSFDWYLNNFRHEAELLANLNHPNIVRVLQFFNANGTSYYVMPYIEGISLSEFRDTYGAPNEEWLVDFLKRMLSALDYIHSHNLLHRDIKPGNILLTQDGIPELIDFGSARQIVSEKTQTILATQGYAPLEQLQARGNTGPWSDVYSLAGTVYKLLTGENPPQSVDRISDTNYIPLAHRLDLKGYSYKLLSSIDKAFAIQPETRWQNANEWLDCLEGRIPPPEIPFSTPAMSQNMAGTIPGVPPIPPTQVQSPHTTMPPVGKPQRKTSNKTLKRITITASAVILLLAGFIVWNISNKSWSTETQPVSTSEEQHLFDVLATYNMDQQKLESALSSLKNVNLVSNDESLITPLGIAVANNDLQAAKLLLQCSADPNYPVGPNQTPPLHLAIANENREMIELLITNKALLDPGCIRNAIRKRNRELISFFAKQNINYTQEDKLQLLYTCIDEAYPDGFRELKNNNLLPDMANDQNALFLLQTKESPQFLDLAYLLFEAGVPATNTLHLDKLDKTYDLLTFALDTGNNKNFMEQFVKLALDHQANPNYSIPETGETALYLAVKNGLDPIAKLLLDKDADCNVTLKDSPETPFYLALSTQKADLVKIMLEHKADPNKPLSGKQSRGYGYGSSEISGGASNNRLTPLGIVISCATEDNSSQASEIMHHLLDHGADPALKVDGKQTPLILLANNSKWDKHSQKEAFNLLCNKGATKNLDDSDFSSLLGNLVSNEKDDLANSLLESIPQSEIESKMTELLCSACAQHNPDAVKFLLEHGAKADKADKNGKTPLWHAIPEYKSDSRNALACIRHLKAAGISQPDSQALAKLKEYPDSSIQDLFGVSDNEDHSADEESKPAVIGVMMSGKPSDAGKAIKAIEAYVQQSNDTKDKMVLSQLKTTITELYQLLANTRRAVKRNKADIAKAQRLRANAGSWLQANPLTGRSNPEQYRNNLSAADNLINNVKRSTAQIKGQMGTVNTKLENTYESLEGVNRLDDKDILEQSAKLIMQEIEGYFE